MQQANKRSWQVGDVAIGQWDVEVRDIKLGGDSELSHIYIALSSAMIGVHCQTCFSFYSQSLSPRWF